MCKRSDTFSLAVLIGRGLDLLAEERAYHALPDPRIVRFSGLVARYMHH